MADFEFDRAPSPGTNRSVAVTDCPTCGGDRFVQVDEIPGSESAADPPHETYARCPNCNPEEKR